MDGPLSGQKSAHLQSLMPSGIGVHRLKSMLKSGMQEISGFEDLPLAVREIAHFLLRKAKPDNP